MMDCGKQLLLALLAGLMVSAISSCSSPNGREKESGTIIKVMTYNVHHCNPPGKPDLIDVSLIAAEIKKQKADVVAVQEVDVDTKRSGSINQAKQLADETDLAYYYFGKAMDYDGGEYGVLILSRLPLSDMKTFALPMAEEKGGEPRVLATATVTASNGKAFRFGSTHLEAYNKESRLLQINEITRIAGETSLPFVAAGDFNATEEDEVIQILDKNFTRTCQNCPSTFWEEGETGAIDFIAFRPAEKFSVLTHEVIQNKEASDHMPVVARLELQ